MSRFAPGPVKPSPKRTARRSAAGVKPPSQIGGGGRRVGAGVNLIRWESENALLKGDGFARESSADDVERLVGARAALLGGHAEARKLFTFEADPDTKFETAARDDINGRNILGKAYRIVERHQQHAGCDADAVGAGG